MGKVICEAATNCTHKTCPARVEHDPVMILTEDGDYILCSQHSTKCSHSKREQICVEKTNETPTY